jgi:hypothetical protein
VRLIGLGVAALFDKACNRGLKRVENQTETFTANREHWYLRRSPVESVASLEQKYSEAEGWVALSAGELIRYRDDESGLLWFSTNQADDRESMLRVTYTGGHWFDDTENETGDMPAGAAALPDDVKLAWLLQCQHVWNERDKFGAAITDKAGQQSKLSALALVPEVLDILKSYRRLCLT